MVNGAALAGSNPELQTSARWAAARRPLNAAEGQQPHRRQVGCPLGGDSEAAAYSGLSAEPTLTSNELKRV